MCHMLVWYLEIKSKDFLCASEQKQTINKKAGK